VRTEKQNPHQERTDEGLYQPSANKEMTMNDSNYTYPASFETTVGITDEGEIFICQDHHESGEQNVFLRHDQAKWLRERLEILLEQFEKKALLERAF